MPRRRVRSSGGASRIQRLLTFALAAALIVVYALRGGGSYDIVSYEQEALVVWLALALGIGCGLLPRARPALGQLLVLAALLAYTGWTALSLTWTSSSELTWAEVVRCLDYLGAAALLCAIFDRDTWRDGAAGIALGAMFVCIYAVGSRLAPSVFGHDHVDALLGSDRLSIPFGYWNSVGAWGAMCVTIGLAWSAHDTTRWRRSLALALVPFAGVTVYLTYSRGGIAGTALGVLLVLALSRNRWTAALHGVLAGGGTALAILAVRGAPEIAHATGTRGAGTVLAALLFAVALCAVGAWVTSPLGLDRLRMPKRLMPPLAAIAALIVIALAVAVGPHLVSHAWHSFKQTPVVSTNPNPTARLSSLSSSRYPVWKSSLTAFGAHPVDGIGAGTFEFWWNRRGTTAEHLLDVHNIWLENLAELGVPGLLLIVAVAGTLLGLAVSARRRARRATSAGITVAFAAALFVYLLQASFDWLWESTAVTVLVLAGVLILGARLSGPRPRFRAVIRIGVALAASLAAIAQLPALVSNSDIRDSQAAERAGNASRALTLASNALSAEPWSASAYQQRGLVLEAGGDLTSAAANLRHAVSDEPLNYEHWLVLSRIELEAGHLTAAQRDYQRAHELAPRAEAFTFAPYFRGAQP